ncbi:MAG TPA: LLM class flavin-dependent oxidoreductase [Pseudolysinimonas sp.]|nr:LLM class flavin-dependent oxidoreductase [Pseudolysinimonas sp.]
MGVSTGSTGGISLSQWNVAPTAPVDPKVASSVPLSVLDLASVYDGGSHAGALADTLIVAREADRLGYRRFWVAEHHGMPAVASSSPAVLLAAVAAVTTNIRIGSGGVMLPNHSSLIVAEQFGTLVALYGDRVDLGLGRAPGTDGVVMAKIRRGGIAESADDFPQQLSELLAYFGSIPALDTGEGSRILAIPGMGDAPQLWLLGSSDFSARLAGRLGLRFAFAHHFGGGAGGVSGSNTPLVFDLYRRSFRPSALMTEPHAMVSATTLVADDAAEARRLLLPHALMMLRLRSGLRPGRVPSLAEAESYEWTPRDNAFVDQTVASQAIGDVAHVRARIDALAAETGADEFLVVPQGPSVETRLRTVRELG